MTDHDHTRDEADQADRADQAARWADDVRLGAVIAAVQPDDFELEHPRPALWNAIAAARREEVVRRAADDGHPSLSGARLLGPDPEPAAVPPDRWSRPRRLAAAAAAAVALVAAGATVAVVRSGDSASKTVLASASLSSDGLDGAPPGLVGSAVVEQSSSRRVLRVEIGDVGPGSGRYLELWLIQSDISGMVSLGAVRMDGTYDLPVGLETDEYPIVDVSTESWDGDPAHSGRSLLRGQLADT